MDTAPRFRPAPFVCAILFDYSCPCYARNEAGKQGFKDPENKVRAAQKQVLEGMKSSPKEDEPPPEKEAEGKKSKEESKEKKATKVKKGKKAKSGSYAFKGPCLLWPGKSA